MANGRVLVVDNDPDVVQTLRDMLAALRYDVTTAGTFDDARTAVTTIRPHVILLDLRMPGTSGLDALGYLRERHGAIPVIVVSGAIEPPVADAARAAGAFDVVSQPFDAAVLQRLVAQAMESAPRG
jgi:CheY-like chemotaxis protein